ncbi:MAG: hypothetical protein QG642_428, partial [Patescibacteria group bacterium]|nr:hypothetical protein [Patescibacteria group bacterium]
MQIKKRHGHIEDLDLQKIINSLRQAIVASGLEDNPLAERFADQTMKYLKASYQDDEMITSDDVRSAVNIVLLENNLPQVAKLYFQKRGQKIDNQGKIFHSMAKIKKRDGTMVDYDKNKVFQAINKAGQAANEYDELEAKKLTDIVNAVLEQKFDGHDTPTVEQIQDVIEIIL